MATSWEQVAAAKKEEIFQSIPAQWRLRKVPSAQEQINVTGSFAHQFLTPEEIEITETDAVGIAKNVSTGHWSAVTVTGAFCHRAAIAHQLLNCLHETFFDAALEDAKRLDEYYATHKQTIGPLHGVPISLKDQFHVKNVETSMGYVGWIGTFEGKKGDARFKTHESEMVRELRQLGAVLYCKTSVPHTLMTGETVNNIIGYTWNPANRFLSSGGSSGGEGSLIAFRGSPIGLGSDIGGSVRIPAAFNGLFGLRPSYGRLPYEGVANSMDGQNSVLSVLGPLASTLGSLKLLFKSLLSQEPWLFDPNVVEMPWNDQEEQLVLDRISGKAGKKLTFAVFKNDGVVTPHPPVARAIQAVVDALSKAGHQVIDWKPPRYFEGLENTRKAWTSDGGVDVHSALNLSGEPIAPQVSSMYGLKPSAEMTASEMAANNVAIREWRKASMDYWNSTSSVTDTGLPVDAVIFPVAPFAAAIPERFSYYGYTCSINGLDWPSIVVPVTTADQEIDQAHAAFEPMSKIDEEIQQDYKPEVFHGAPVGVQLIGRRFKEEKMITIADYVSRLLAAE